MAVMKTRRSLPHFHTQLYYPNMSEYCAQTLRRFHQTPPDW